MRLRRGSTSPNGGGPEASAAAASLPSIPPISHCNSTLPMTRSWHSIFIEGSCMTLKLDQTSQAPEAWLQPSPAPPQLGKKLLTGFASFAEAAFSLWTRSKSAEKHKPSANSKITDHLALPEMQARHI